MPKRVFLDTNILVYSRDEASPRKDGSFQVLLTQDTTESVFEDKLFGIVGTFWSGGPPDQGREKEEK